MSPRTDRPPHSGIAIANRGAFDQQPGDLLGNGFRLRGRLNHR
jgi:hypothetical protein